MQPANGTCGEPEMAFPGKSVSFLVKVDQAVAHCSPCFAVTHILYACRKAVTIYKKIHVQFAISTLRGWSAFQVF